MASTTENGSAPMTLARLQMLLDAYGASPDRWPPEVCESALALLATSADARLLRDQAASLDALLDVVPDAQPSPALVARALAGAPRVRVQRLRRPMRRWHVAAALVPLAAAATAVIWIFPRGSATSNAPAQYAIADLGSYSTPTDVLLQASGFDVLRSAPVIGCGTDGLACPIDDTDVEPQSAMPGGARRMA